MKTTHLEEENRQLKIAVRSALTHLRSTGGGGDRNVENDLFDIKETLRGVADHFDPVSIDRAIPSIMKLFYQQVAGKDLWEKEEGMTNQVFLAAHASGAPHDCIAGGVRVTTEHDVNMIRSLYILPEYRSQGVGTKLLKSALELLDGERAYALAPYDSVHLFYKCMASNVIMEEQQRIPPFIIERWHKYDNEQRENAPYARRNFKSFVFLFQFN